MIGRQLTEFDGPIAGENYTSDTRNYPWHRPPDLVDYDDIVEDLLVQTSEPERMTYVMSLLSSGVTIASLVDAVLMTNIAKGRMPIDMAILAAGPLAKFVDILSEDAGISTELGLDGKGRLMTPDMVESLSGGVNHLMRNPMQEREEVMEDEVVVEEISKNGLMSAPTGPAPEEEQRAMLGEEMTQEENING